MSKRKSSISSSAKKKIAGLRLVAESLGYDVVMRRVKSMRKDDIGLTCPDLQKIYLDPNSDIDLVSTLAHEIGHVILMVLRTPGHRTDEDTDFDLKIAENAADLIGEAICATIGHQPDYTGFYVKAVEQITCAASRYANDAETYAFLQGYCAALADVLPCSTGAENLAKLACEIRERMASRQLKKDDADGTKVQADGLRFSRSHRSGKPRWREHRRSQNHKGR